MSVPTNVRFPQQVDVDLATYAHRVGAPKSTVVVDALREWLRMQANPGVVFVSTVTGERRAALAAGPQVWTVAESWQQHDRDDRSPAVVADAVGLSVGQVETALRYWADHPAEIDDVIQQHQQDADRALAAWQRRQALDER